jgi:hypothetical protein
MVANVISSQTSSTDHVVEFPMNGNIYTAKVFIGKWGVDVDWFIGEDLIAIDDRWKVLPTELYDLDDSDWEEILFP